MDVDLRETTDFGSRCCTYASEFILRAIEAFPVFLIIFIKITWVKPKLLRILIFGIYLIFYDGFIDRYISILDMYSV